MTSDDPVVTVLSQDECWALLRSSEVGRLAVVVHGRPEIFPVNFVVDHGTVVFRSAGGTKLSGLEERAAAAFEADGYDRHERTAWSVVAHGAVEPFASVELVDTDNLPLYPLMAGPKPRFIRIVADSISGRRFRTVEPDAWQSHLARSPRQAWE